MPLESEASLIELIGEFDLTNARELHDRIMAATEDRRCNLIVDMSEATFIDSTILGVLLSGMKRLTPRGRQLLIVCPPGYNCRIFEITGLDRILPIYERRDEAVASVDGSGADGGS